MKKHSHFDSSRDRKLIFSIAMCEFLIEKGFLLQAVMPHKHDTNRLVFAFENSNELHYAIDEYLVQAKSK